MTQAHPSKRAQLIVALNSLNDKGKDDAVVEQLAADINWHINLLRVQQAEARRLGKSAGPAKELRDLARAARRAMNGKLDAAGWATAWATVPNKIRQRIWRPKSPPIVSRKLDASGRQTAFRRAPFRDFQGGFRAEGIYMLVPKQKDVLASITTERENIMAVPCDDRRKRKCDEAEHAAIKAIRSAY